MGLRLGTGWATPAGWCGPQTIPWWLWLCVWGHCPAGRWNPSANKAAVLTGGVFQTIFRLSHGCSSTFAWKCMSSSAGGTSALSSCYKHMYWMAMKKMTIQQVKSKQNASLTVGKSQSVVLYCVLKLNWNQDSRQQGFKRMHTVISGSERGRPHQTQQ